MNAVKDQVIRLISEQLGGDDEKEITVKSRLREELGVDSIDMVELLITMEEVFDIEVSDNIAETIRTVGDVVHTVTILKAK